MFSVIKEYFAANGGDIGISFVLFVFGYLMYRSSERSRTEMKETFERDLERLSAENHHYRQMFFTLLKGMPKEDYDQLSAKSAVSWDKKQKKESGGRRS